MYISNRINLGKFNWTVIEMFGCGVDPLLLGHARGRGNPGTDEAELTSQRRRQVKEESKRPKRLGCHHEVVLGNRSGPYPYPSDLNLKG